MDMTTMSDEDLAAHAAEILSEAVSRGDEMLGALFDAVAGDDEVRDAIADVFGYPPADEDAAKEPADAPAPKAKAKK